MSLSVVQHDDGSNQNECEEIKAALLKAYGKNIIVFCSQRDGSQGSTQSIMKGLPGVISIGAATAFGKQAKFVPDGANFILPGHQVSLLDPASGTSTIESGSSISTALAAGLAALILRCEEIVRTQSQLPSPSESLNRMNLRKYIKYIFHRLSDKDTGYVQVTKTFLMYENDSQANQIDKVRQMLERIYHTS